MALKQMQGVGEDQLEFLSVKGGERMHPLTFVIVFGILGMIGVFGALLLVTSLRRLVQLAGSPGFALQHAREEMATTRAALYTFLLVLGFLMLGFALRGVYRIIWATY